MEGRRQEALRATYEALFANSPALRAQAPARGAPGSSSSTAAVLGRFHNMEPKHAKDVSPLPESVGTMRRR